MVDSYSPAFGNLLRRYRRGLGTTQRELATKAGYSEVYIGMLERGERLPSAATVRALAEALALTASDFATLSAAARDPHYGATSFAPEALPFATQARRAVPARLVGRAQELSLLENHLRGEGTALLAIAGEPGIGKTRLLQEIAQHAPRDGWTVLSGATHPLSGQEPYTPLLGALERYLHTASPETLQRDLTGCAWLVRLLPELSEAGIAPLPDWRLPPQQERRLIFKAARRFLANVSGPAGTLLVLDDVQWASLDALDLVLYLVRSPADTPLRIVLSYRSTEVRPEDPLGVLMTDLARVGQASKIELGPLRCSEAKELLGNMLEESFSERGGLIEQVLQRAEGMPLFLVSFAQTLRTSSDSAEESAAEKIPRDVVEGIQQRVAVLPGEAQELLAVASIVGRQAPRRLLTDILMRRGQPEENVLAALEAACRARLLIEEDEDTYVFAHDLIHEAIIETLGAARRGVMHRQVAEALERGPGRPSPELLADHFARGGALERAAWYLERAGDHATELRAHGAAARAYQEAAARLDHLERPREAAAVREKLGIALMTSAQHDAALEALDQAVETYGAERDVEGVVRVIARVGEVHALRGTAEQCIPRLEAVLTTLGDNYPHPRSVASLCVTLAWLVNTTGRYPEALELARRAVDLASAAGDPVLVVQANLRYGHLLLMLERVDEGVSILEKTIPQASAIGDLRGLRFVLNSLGWVHELRGDFEQDRIYTDRAFRAAEQLDDPTVLAFMRSNHGSPKFNLGDWAQARVDFEAGLALMRQQNASWASAWPPLLLGQLCLAEGQRAQAEELLCEAIGLAQRNMDLEALRWAHGTLAERDLIEGAPESAIERLQPLLDRPGQREIDVCALLPSLAMAHADLGHLEQAEVIAREALDRAAAAGMRPALASARRALAAVAQRLNHWQLAHSELQQALALSRAMRHPYGEAKLLYALGMLHTRQGEHREARPYFSEALGILSRLGERLYAERAERALVAFAVPGSLRSGGQIS